MSNRCASAIPALTLLLVAAPAWPQAASGSLQGRVTEVSGSGIAAATVDVRNVETNASRSATTDADGRFRIAALPVGRYELRIGAAGFAHYVRTGVTIAVDQDAVIDVEMKGASFAETVTVVADAPLVNTTNAEVGVRFDQRRVSELPISPDRNIYGLALSAPGVSQLGSGQQGYASSGATTGGTSLNFSSNGMRIRSNNFMIDGQDVNDPNFGGVQQSINNPDIVQEVLLVTNQFAAEYGRNPGAVMNVVTKSGSNEVHGTAFWFENRCGEEGADRGGICMNARTNLDEAADRQLGRDRDRFRREHQFGGTLGGPIFEDRTFFFASYQRWTNEELASGFTIGGAPTSEGRAILDSVAGREPQVRALLDFLPPAPVANGESASFTRDGVTYVVPLGDLTGEAPQEFRNHQASLRLDHNFNSRQVLSARYLISDTGQSGQGQLTPPGLTFANPVRQQSFGAWLTSVLSANAVNELRAGIQALDNAVSADDPLSASIPSIAVTELGLTGQLAVPNRTAIGLAVNIPSSRNTRTIQLQDTLTWHRGRHTLKFGADVRRTKLDTFLPTFFRGNLRYASLQALVDDSAEVAQVARSLPGGQEVQQYEWWDVAGFAQDEWEASDTVTLSIGLRYEAPGNSIASLYPVNEAVVAAAGGDERYVFEPRPQADVNNLEPRLGFNWHPRAGRGRIGRWLTGDRKLVVRGGYARAHDYAFTNMNTNIAGGFPFVALLALPSTRQPDGTVGVSDAFDRLQVAQPTALTPSQSTRTVVAADFHAPAADHFSLEVQRQLGSDFALRVGYVGTRGRGLFQTLDANPRLPYSTIRVDPARGTIRARANTAESTYDSLQLSAEKRLSGGFGAGLHYTFSRFVDTASDILNASVSEIGISQDAFDLEAERARSAYDRPHRLAGNVVWELPSHRGRRGIAAALLDGWQVSATFTLQDGAPFTVLNGGDPTGSQSGINALTGISIRPNLNTELDLAEMTIEEILDAGGASLFRRLCGDPTATCPGERVGDVPRNSLRADGIANIDLALVKNVRVGEEKRLQLWIQMFNATNTRNFGIPDGNITSVNFLDEKMTNGGNRRIVAALRFVF